MSTAFSETSPLSPHILEIGDWDMDAVQTKSVAHGLGAAWKNIRSISYVVRNDDDDTYFASDRANNVATGFLSIEDFDATNVNLEVNISSGEFDNVNFDSTSYNRGWVTIWTTP